MEERKKNFANWLSYFNPKDQINYLKQNLLLNYIIEKRLFVFRLSRLKKKQHNQQQNAENQYVIQLLCLKKKTEITEIKTWWSLLLPQRYKSNNALWSKHDIYCLTKLTSTKKLCAQGKEWMISLQIKTNTTH